ncbi:hypothetical protein [Sphingomonas japonica]|uniref:Uncharacterized protein n=1 Tax=Sphingomonas japonica TaxID=511662 RepID=A0ABX0TWR4_9SPHN|nr:hypothetical protein [Sphingomonas japonica]NIJ22754.1 hypothetical protein [Sphingomonas japonica]
MLLWLAAALGVAGVAALRYAWTLPRRSTGWNAVAWLLIAASVACGWRMGGAWGVSVAALATTAAAFAMLAAAGIGAPPGRTAASVRWAGMLPQAGEPRRIGRRIATFLIVIPGGFVIAIVLGIAMRGVATASGWGEANANVAALFTVPLGWAVLVTTLLMQGERRGQLLTLSACAAAGAPFLLTGLGS